MSFQTIHIIRELADRGGRSASKERTFCCFDGESPPTTSWEPNTDIVESEDLVEIRIELAGISREQVSIHLKNGNLYISGIRKENKLDKKVYYHQLELHYGHFMKVISLPESIEHNDITANLSEGILEIKISKKSTVIEIPVISKVDIKKL